jgi:hypothetical protein
MKIAIDLDGTLTRDTDRMQALMKELIKGGNEVYILSCCLKNTPTERERMKQIKLLGLAKGVDFTDHIFFSVDKVEEMYGAEATWCRDNWIDFVFEDEDAFIMTINKVSPFTSTWLIRRFQ